MKTDVAVGLWIECCLEAECIGNCRKIDFNQKLQENGLSINATYSNPICEYESYYMTVIHIGWYIHSIVLLRCNSVFLLFGFSSLVTSFILLCIEELVLYRYGPKLMVPVFIAILVFLIISGKTLLTPLC